MRHLLIHYTILGVRPKAEHTLCIKVYTTHAGMRKALRRTGLYPAVEGCDGCTDTTPATINYIAPEAEYTKRKISPPDICSSPK